MPLRSHSLIDRLDELARSRPQSPAFIQGDRTLRFGEFAHRVRRLVSGLNQLGLNPGARVAVLLDNSLETVLTYGACLQAGLITVGLNTRTSAEEMSRVLEKTTPQALVFQSDYQKQAQVLKPQVKHWISTDSVPESLSLSALEAEVGTLKEVNPEAGCAIIPTAAVGGEPKGALLSQQNLMASCQMHLMHFGPESVRGHLGIMPLFHVMGMTSLWATFVCGGTTVLLPQFDPQASVAAIDEHQLTYFGSFPPILGRVLDAATEASSTLPSLRVVYGLEGPDNIRRLEEQTAARFWGGFGQAETCAFVTAAPASERPGSSGRASFLNAVAVVNEADELLPPGGAGEIVVQGENVMLEYWGHEEATAHVFRNGWHHTGDIGRFDDEGYLFYIKRKAEKELIKTGGENVYPGEVEAVLKKHPDLVEACVIGVPDSNWGESVKAICVLREGASLDAEGVRGFVGQHIAGFKRPRLVEFVEALPEKDGEVDRDAVKAQYGHAA